LNDFKPPSLAELDTLIAAHSMALEVTLVTANVRESQRVQGLNVQNWRGF
jgi:tRNA(fMet)-specific endonuclease VapC